MLFLANEPAILKAEIKYFDGTRYNRAWVLGRVHHGQPYRGHIKLRISREPTSLWFFLYFLFLLLFFFQEHSIFDYIVKSRRKGFELEPWFLPRFPARIFSLRGFFWAGFFWPPSYRICFSCKQQLSSASFQFVLFSRFLSYVLVWFFTIVQLFLYLINIFTLDVYEINHLIFYMFIFYQERIKRTEKASAIHTLFHR